MVNLFANHNIVVVTSPIGENAPPALAAITIAEADLSKFFPLKNLLAICKNTIVVVRLSRKAEETKASNAIIKNWDLSPNFNLRSFM